MPFAGEFYLLEMLGLIHNLVLYIVSIYLFDFMIH